VADPGVAESGRHPTGIQDGPAADVLIRRTASGWRVEGGRYRSGEAVDDLDTALALADLIAEGSVPGPRPPRPAEDADELARLRTSVRQLEHALASRVTVEQAIGVLSERWKAAPRDAFERLRRVTRSHGLRIHELAKLVIESITNPDCGLPTELDPVQRNGDAPPEPRQSPDGRGPREGRTRRSRSADPAPAQAQTRSQRQSNGGRSRVEAVPAPRS